jgi:hypothetical protein
LAQVQDGSEAFDSLVASCRWPNEGVHCLVETSSH